MSFQPEEVALPEVDLPKITEPEPETAPKFDPRVKKYRCLVKCWLSSRALLCDPGDIVEFAAGEEVPPYFDLAE